MSPTIESRVQRGTCKGDPQTRWQDADGICIASAGKSDGEHVRIADLPSLANVIAGGLKVRMKAAREPAAGLVRPEAVTIDGSRPEQWQHDRRVKLGRP